MGCSDVANGECMTTGGGVFGFGTTGPGSGRRRVAGGSRYCAPYIRSRRNCRRARTKTSKRPRTVKSTPVSPGPPESRLAVVDWTGTGGAVTDRTPPETAVVSEEVDCADASTSEG